MKKLYYIMTLMFITLLASCSQQELVNQEAAEGRVSISAELPASIAATRAQIAVPATHQLRCIIEVWTNSASPVLKYRQEVAVASGAFPTFDFALRPGDYNCLMWADFIKKDAATTEMTVEDVAYTHFEDFIYDTSDLRAIAIKEGATDHLFDTDLCDGFYATLSIKKNATAVQQTMQLKRPFAKLIVKESNAEKFATLEGMSLECQLPNSFNVATGEPGKEMMTVAHEKTFEQGDASQVLFTEYVFAPSTGLSMSSFLLAFNTSEGNSRCEIPAGSIKLKRNQQMVAGGKVMEGGTVTPKPDEPTPDRDPQVGDYFFIDGTWNSELTDANKADCVGIVYAVGAQPGDDISNYPDSEGKSIKGYVMALKNIDAKSYGMTDGNESISWRPYLYKHNNKVRDTSVQLFDAVKPDKTNFTGYSKTNDLLNSELFKAHTTDWSYPVLQVLTIWKQEYAAKPKNASQWYIPSVAQLYAAAGGCYGVASASGYPAVDKVDALSEAFNTAIGMKIAEVFTTHATSGYYVYTSCLNNQANGTGPCFAQINNVGTSFKPKEHPAEGAQGVVRPVLTIIK